MTCRYDTEVEDILNSATALDYFKQWMRLDPERPEEATDLYFALRGFKNYLRSPDAGARAQLIHRKYISLKSGTCDFLPEEARQEMSDRIHALKPSSAISAMLFDPVWQPLLDQLKLWHARFVCSELFNKLKEAERAGFGEEYLPLAPPETMRRPRKPRYTCDPSTSRLVVEEKKQDFPYKHEIPEERERFARELTLELQRIAEQLSHHGEDVYPRELPKLLPEPSPPVEKVHEKTLSDEEVEEALEKYVEKMARELSDSESPPNLFPPGTFPPPLVRGYDFNITIPKRFTGARKPRSSGFNDTSGFCSSESAYFSSDPSYISNPFVESRFSQSSYSQTMQRRPRAAQTNTFATLPRRSTQGTQIQCRLWRDDEVAPYTANLQGPVITLFQFRKTFAIRRNESLRLLFKSPCEDKTAPFQWSLVRDDEAILPLFEGKIIAEARRYVDSD